MPALRTPSSRFENLPDYPFEPHWLDLRSGLRMHYVDEGPVDASPVLMLHGEPTWSYLYRTMIPVFAEAGLRAIAPDLVGFGKSDKPDAVSDYSYKGHVDWLKEWMEELDLRDITLVCQDWGSLLGLRLAAENGDRFARIVVANGTLPTGDRGVPIAFKAVRAIATYSPVHPIGLLVAALTNRRLSRGEISAYDAPFPSSRYKAGVRAFPNLVPTSPDAPAAAANRAAWRELGRWEKPFLTLFGTGDPILGRHDKPLQKHIPGARNQPHDRLPGGQFIQEDQGEEIARRTVEWIMQTTTG